ncbi:MAG: glycoside hydrolase family 99-like domain-containing protein [Pirellulaceae bacterium]
MVLAWVLVLAACAALGTPAVAGEDVQVVCEWDFSRGMQGWVANSSARVQEGKDGIVIETDGRDAQLMSPKLDIAPQAGDVLEVRMSASRVGEIQWFWRTETAGPLGGLSQERSRFATVEESPNPQILVARPFWKTDKNIIGLRFDLPEGAAGTYCIASIRVLRGSNVLPPTWRREYRVPVAPRRIDVAKEAPPSTTPVTSDYTVAMWYFAAWEPEYTWDGWRQVAERSPWRIPLLFDSSDKEMSYNGIQFYRASNSRVVDWHVHWMREHCVNLMLWDWYPGRHADGTFDPTFFGNRALEIGFLGKEKLGGPAVATNRFAETMPFAIMWTNHAPANRLGNGLAEYIVDQFFVQPNYYKIDGKAFFPLWSPADLVSGAGGEPQAKAVLDHLREYALSRGIPGVYVVAVNGASTREQISALGIDGVMGYNVLLAGGSTTEYRQVAERVFEDRLEDFRTQSIRGHAAVWARQADLFGRDGFVPTCPMQNWEPTLRSSSYVMRDHTPEAYGELLTAAKAFIEQRGLRKFVSIEAFNEWLEGSYVEPSTQWGLTYLEVIREAFRTR